MGLDTYAYSNNKAMPAHLFAHIPPVLVGGIFSGNGQTSSFRGKVYAPFLYNAIGLDLYQEEIPHDVVVRAADQLDKWLSKNPEQEFSDISREEIVALSKWFRVVAENGGTVGGWW